VFISSPSAYISYLFHVPHIVRAILGYNISLFLFPDLLSRMDQTVLLSATMSFGEFLKKAVAEFKDEVRIGQLIGQLTQSF
jgi:hypothetical protein